MPWKQWENFGSRSVFMCWSLFVCCCCLFFSFVLLWSRSVFDLYLWSGFMFVFDLCFFLSLFSFVLLWYGCVCVWSLFLSSSFFHLCCCDLGLSYWLWVCVLVIWVEFFVAGFDWEEHEEQVVMFLWKLIMICNNFFN